MVRSRSRPSDWIRRRQKTSRPGTSSMPFGGQPHLATLSRRARNIFILRCGTKDYVLFVPQSRQRINSGRSPCRRIASENRGTYEDDAGQHQGSRIIGLGLEQKRFDKLGRD